MPLIGIIAGICALGFVGFRLAGAGAANAGTDFLAAFLNAGKEGAELAVEWLLDKYELHILPWLKKVGWLTLWGLVMTSAGIWMLRIPDAPLAPTSAIAVISIMAGVNACILALAVLRKSSFESSSFALLSAPVVGTALVGITCLFAGAFAHARSLVLIGASYLLCSSLIFSWLAELATEIGEEGTAALRRISDNWVFRKSAEFAAKLENGSAGIYRRLVARIAPIVIPLVLIPSPITLAFCATVGVVLHFAWTNLEDKGIDTDSRYKQSALTLELLSYMLIPFLLYVLFVPGGEERVDEFTGWCLAVLSCQEILSWKTIAIWVLIGAVAMKYVYPWGEAAKGKILRQVAAIPLAAMALICLVNFGGRFLPKKASAASPAPVASIAPSPPVHTAASTPPIASVPPVMIEEVKPEAVKPVPLPSAAKATPACPGGSCDLPKETLDMCASLGIPCE